VKKGPRRLLVPHRKAPANAGQGKLGLSQGPFASALGVAGAHSRNSGGGLFVNDSQATLHIKSPGLHGSADRDPNETQVTLPDQYQWKPGLPGAPAQSVETVPVFGATDKPGLYVVLIKWHPGFMSAPHTYVTDRLCFVISGTWWVNSGENFEPENTVPVPAGGFVRRVAHTPHYDGVRKGGKEPAVIGIFGQAPIEFKLVDPTKPRVRAV
jgi:hypothetical protein